MVANIPTGVDASEVKRRYDNAKSNRYNFENEWQEIVKYILPNNSSFYRTANDAKGETVRQYMLDQTGELALRDLVSFIVSNVCAIGTRWVTLLPEDPSLIDSEVEMKYLDSLSRRVEKYLQKPEVRFHLAIDESMEQCVGLGQGCVYRHEKGTGKNLRYSYEAIPVEELYCLENNIGVIDTVFRKKYMTAKQILNEYGEDAELSSNTEAMDTLKQKIVNDPNFEYTIVQAVYRRSETEFTKDKSNVNSKKYEFASVHFFYEGISSSSSKENNPVVARESGYKRFPFYFYRMKKRPGEVYGRGCGHAALYGIRVLNKMCRTNLECAELVAAPPMDVPYTAYMRKINLSSRAINLRKSVGLSVGEKATPMHVVGDLPISLDMEDRRRELVKKAFFSDKLIESKNAEMSATESNIRQNERLSSMLPEITRIICELFNPLIEDCIDMLIQSEMVEDMSDDLKEQGISPVYVNAIIKAQSAQMINAFNAFAATLTQLQPQDPEIVYAMNTKEVPKMLIEGLGLPYSILATREEREGATEQARQQAQMQADIAMQVEASKAGLNVAKSAQALGI